jgi:hypothetical protein
MIRELEVVGYLEDIADQDHISDGYRPRAEAHRISTAYHILHDVVTIDDLRRHPSDLDGTTWYREDWEYLFPACESGDPLAWLLKLRVKSNAALQVPRTYWNAGETVWVGILPVPSPSYALEGYPAGDVRRLPNTDDPRISKHVLGLAVDVAFGWAVPFSSRWDEKIDSIARDYNLVRPFHNFVVTYANTVIDEFWHFERQ